jgi:hypothetical protein
MSFFLTFNFAQDIECPPIKVSGLDAKAVEETVTNLKATSNGRMMNCTFTLLLRF